MVERPIKKADRQSQPATENDGTAKSAEAPKKSNSSRGKDKDKDKGKRSNKKEDAQPPVNLALMRGPKPSKAKPPVLKAEDAEEATDAATEDTAVETETTEES